MTLPVSSAPTQTFTATALSQIISGTSGNDKLVAYGYPGFSGDTLVGGKGDDSYYVHSGKDTVKENAGEGTDTVYSDWIYALPANVENLVLVGNLSVNAVGNTQANLIFGNAADNVIDGGAGNDELWGGGGHDIFNILNNDTIFDFAADDYVNLYTYSAFTSFAQVKAAMTQKGSDVYLKLTTGDSVSFKNKVVSDFSVNQFLLKNQVANYALTFNDDFNSLSLYTGSTSSGTWYGLYPRSDIAGHTTVDHGSIQYFTYPGDIDAFGNAVTVNPFATNNGVLSITMNPVAAADQAKFAGYAYTSGMINTIGSFAQTYGYFEIRAKLAAGQGLHDAFWMLPVDGSWPPELDVVEQRGSDPTQVIGVSHATDNGTDISYSKQLTVATATTEFHTYGLDWEPDYLTWYIDGIAVRTMPTWPGMDKPMYLIANLGGGGAWAGNPDGSTPFPATMQIDYIRAYASQYTVEQPGVGVTKIGTDGNDTLQGTSANDVLNGAAGDDMLYGGAGNDTLTGGGGSTDILDGGFGDDTYLVNTTADVATEGANKGIDTVRTTLSNYTLPVNLENLVYVGIGTHNLTGNQADNVITGGDGGGAINASDGNDTVYGGAGADTLSGGDGNDLVRGNGGGDVIRGNAGDDVLYGDGGDDVVKGDDGNDLLYGGAGKDNLQGGAGNDVLTGDDGDDSLDGGGGIDQLIGGLGNDTYFADTSDEIVVEKPGEGVDLVKARSDSFALPDNVENLTYIGTGSFSGIGNALGNRIVGGAGNDLLDGGAGADILTGGGGTDTFRFLIGEANGDTVMDFAAGDKLAFAGYGLDATFAQVGTSDFYTIAASNGSIVETIEVVGVTTLTSADVIMLAAINRAPSAITLSAASVSEAAAKGKVVGTLASIDPDFHESSRFRLVDDAGGRFAVVGNELIVNGALDFEVARSLTVMVEVQDSAGHILDRPFNIAIGDANDNAPVLTSPAAAVVAENTRTVLALTATDIDTTGEPTTFSIKPGASDGALFAISGNTLSFVSAPDFEDPNHAPVYGVTVVASDGTNSSEQTIQVRVGDVNDTAPVITSAASAAVAENTTKVMDLAATDADTTGEATTYAIVPGVGDAAKFAIVGNTLSFVSAPDFESADPGPYSVTVVASDGTNSSRQTIAVTVKDVNDTAPAITSPATVAVAENTIKVIDLTASDVDTTGEATTYAVLPGAGDAALFRIVGSTLQFVAAPDFEAPAHGPYSVTVVASDGVNASLQTIAVAVADANDNAPALTTPALVKAVEGQADVVALTASDIDTTGEAATYTIKPGVGDASLFTIAGSMLRFVSAPSFATLDHAPDYHLTIVSADGTNSSEQAITVRLDTRLGTTGGDRFVYDPAATYHRVDGLGGDDTFVATAASATLGADGSDATFDFSQDGIIDFATANVEHAVLTAGRVTVAAGLAATALARGDITLHGTAGADLFDGRLADVALKLDGGGGNDMLYGGSLADVLDGGAGNDTMAGGAGDDTYVVDSKADIVTEGANGGIDTVCTALASYTLSANVENLAYTGDAAFTGKGNAAANTLSGGAGNDKLDGQAGADTLIGGLGNDTYTVDDAGDTMVENANEGTDLINAGVSWTLGANLEKLTLTGASAIDGTGNDLANTITGNAAANHLWGLGGDDSLAGGAGNDILEGGIGNDKLNGGLGDDTMIGGAGDDSYTVDSAGDVVIDNPGEGIDSVTASVSYVLADNVEKLAFSGTAALNGTGNALANAISGNGGNNMLDGGAGADTLKGGVGDDTFVFHRGEANGDKVLDFTGAGAPGGDQLQFVGYGAGATLTHVGSGDYYVIHGGIGAESVSEMVRFVGVTCLNASDYTFL